jgi:ubiquinone/menaquinone biosynthesis C-methylase UbiE
MSRPVTLKLLPIESYPRPEHSDPLKFYYAPIFGKMYRGRVELCLGECTGGQRVLEVGYGSGLTFTNLQEMYDEIYGLDLDADAGKVQQTFDAMGIPTQLTNGSVLEMPYPDGHFDTVLLISILEHLKPEQQVKAFEEMRRVLKPGGQVVYGVPVERRLMVVMFRLLGYNIREHHFSTEKDVARAAEQVLEKVRIIQMYGRPKMTGAVYEVGHFVKKA